MSNACFGGRFCFNEDRLIYILVSDEGAQVSLDSNDGVKIMSFYKDESPNIYKELSAYCGIRYEMTYVDDL